MVNTKDCSCPNNPQTTQRINRRERWVKFGPFTSKYERGLTQIILHIYTFVKNKNKIKHPANITPKIWLENTWQFPPDRFQFQTFSQSVFVDTFKTTQGRMARHPDSTYTPLHQSHNRKLNSKLPFVKCEDFQHKIQKGQTWIMDTREGRRRPTSSASCKTESNLEEPAEHKKAEKRNSPPACPWLRCSSSSPAG